MPGHHASKSSKYSKVVIHSLNSSSSTADSRDIYSKSSRSTMEDRSSNKGPSGSHQYRDNSDSRGYVPSSSRINSRGQTVEVIDHKRPIYEEAAPRSSDNTAAYSSKKHSSSSSSSHKHHH